MKIENKTVYFWGYKDIFSNHYKSTIKTNHKTFNTFNCAEQLFMFKKALLFEDYETAKRILLEKNPNNQKKYGRMVKNFDQKVWDGHKCRLMRETLEEKFNQPGMLETLNKYRGYRFVEASPYDKVWGVGLREHDPNVLDETKWNGENLLGKIMTDVFNRNGN